MKLSLDNEIPNKPADKVPPNTQSYLFLCSYASFLSVLVTRFINTPVSAWDLPIFMIYTNSSFDITNAMVTGPKTFSEVITSFSKDAAPNIMELVLLPSGVCMFLIILSF